MEEDKFKDLREDEELKLLRLAALATKREKVQHTTNVPDSTTALPITSIITSSVSTTDAASSQIQLCSANNYLWRKQNQLQRRRGGTFPKNNSRSNLIVINPVSLNEDKGLEGKTAGLVLPQHKWCNSGNEDSMSPKTLRKTGPTRFNRHGSDSESSDSEYENEDSGSNETVLQDEPNVHFLHLSPDSDAASEGVERKRRRSFQNLDSGMQSETFEKTETTSIYNVLKTSSYDCSDENPDNYASVKDQNDNRHAWNHSAENNYSSYQQFNNENPCVSKSLDTLEKFAKKQALTESCVEANSFVVQPSDTTWSQTDVKTTNPYYCNEVSSVQENFQNQGMNDHKSKSYSEKKQLIVAQKDNPIWQLDESFKIEKTNFSDSRYYKEDNVKKLPEDDLRYELKKRAQGMKTCSEINSEKAKHEEYCQKRESFSGDECNPDLNFKQHQRNSSRERSKQSSYRDRNRFGYSSNPENRRGHSRSTSRERHEYSSNRGRSRRDSSRDRWRSEQSSFQSKAKFHSPDKNRHESNFNEEQCKQSLKQDKDNRDFSSDRNRRAVSSCSDNECDRSSSQELELRHSARSRNRNRHEHSSSEKKRRHCHSPGQEKSRSKRNLSRERSRSRHWSSESQGSKNGREHNFAKKKNQNSSNQEDTDNEQNSDQGSYKHTLSSSRNAYYKRNSDKHKTRFDVTVSEDKDGQNYVSSEINASQNAQESGRVRENVKIGKHRNISKQLNERRLHRSSSSEERVRNANKISLRRQTERSRNSRSQSSSSVHSSSSSSSSTYNSKPKIHSMSSVIKSVASKPFDTQSKEIPVETKSFVKYSNINVSQSDAAFTSSKKNIKAGDYKFGFKSGQVDVDAKVASDNNKRVPVHMRLGAFPRKRVIQMPKDVEAAFVNSSSGSDSESLNSKCKKQNIRIVTDVQGANSGVEFEEKYFEKEKSPKRAPDTTQEKPKRFKIKK